MLLPGRDAHAVRQRSLMIEAQSLEATDQIVWAEDMIKNGLSNLIRNAGENFLCLHLSTRVPAQKSCFAFVAKIELV